MSEKRERERVIERAGEKGRPRRRPMGKARGALSAFPVFEISAPARTRCLDAALIPSVAAGGRQRSGVAFERMSTAARLNVVVLVIAISWAPGLPLVPG